MLLAETALGRDEIVAQRHGKIFVLIVLPILVFDLHFPHIVWADSTSLQTTPFARGEFILVPRIQESIVITSRDSKVEIEVPVLSRPLTWKEREIIAVIPEEQKKQKPSPKKMAQRAIKKQQKKLVKTVPKGEIVLTAYSSTKDQTDSSPCITATGFNVCKHNKENIIAANFLPFGTKVRIPELYGDKVFIVQDRMNKRYSQRVDIWMKTRSKAKNFGVKRAKIEVVHDTHEEIAMK